MNVTAPARDTLSTSPAPLPTTLRLVAMSAPALEAPPTPPAPMLVLLPHPADPTPEQVAAKKARRRLSATVQSTDRLGLVHARYFNDAGYDAWGYHLDGHHDPSQVVAATPNPFTH